ncbi:MAG TPA: hypothetical protein VJ501_00630 [Burkholderiaceae bacterium]|nr:hypothetical protein [Burkholderiaceae bacterium]
MSLPLIIKAAALGGAAYAASRWLSAQRRQQRLRSPYPSSPVATHARDDESGWALQASIPRESYPGENPIPPTVSAGPTS